MMSCKRRKKKNEPADRKWRATFFSQTAKKTRFVVNMKIFDFIICYVNPF